MTEIHNMLPSEVIPGFEGWLCLECGRELMLTLTPEYSKLVLNPGDESVSHAGMKGTQ